MSEIQVLRVIQKFEQLTEKDQEILAQAIEARRVENLVTKEEFQKAMMDINTQFAELKTESKWLIRAALYICAVMTAGAIKYFFNL